MVASQLVRVRRLPVPRQVVGCGADHHALARNAARHHAGLVRRLAGADGQVLAILDQVGEAVAEGQVKFQRRMLPRQRQQHGRHERRPKCTGMVIRSLPRGSASWSAASASAASVSARVTRQRS